MDDDVFFTVLEMLTRRTRGLERLEQSILDSQTAILCSNLDGIESGTVLQEQICREIARLDEQMRETWRALESDLPADETMWGQIERLGPGTVQRFERAQAAHDRVQTRIQDLTGVQSALIRRSTRTLAAMQSVIASHYPSYRATKHGIAGTYGPMQGRS